MIKQKWIAVLFFGCIFSQSSAYAMNSPLGVNTVGDLTRAQGKVALLKAELEIARLQAEIKKTKEGKTTDNRPASFPQTTIGPSVGIGQNDGLIPSFVTKNNGKNRFPRVISLSGMAGHYTATIALPNGTVMNANAGGSLGNGWTIVKIDNQGVIASHDGKVVPLAFVSTSSHGESVEDQQPSVMTPAATPMISPLPMSHEATPMSAFPAQGGN